MTIRPPSAKASAKSDIFTLCRMIAVRRVPAASLAALGLSLGALPAQAVTLTPTLIVDAGIVAEANDGKCSIVEAIKNANGSNREFASAGECATGNSTGTIIALPSKSTFVLSSFDGTNSLPPITGTLTIQGNGSTLSPNSGVTTRGVKNQGNLTLQDLNISGFNTTQIGAGVESTGSALNLLRTTVSGNTSHGSTDNVGGVDFAAGASSIINSTISGNSATTGTYSTGGLNLSNGATVTVSQSTITGNSATATGVAAGGVYAYGVSTITISNSIISGNTGAGGTTANTSNCGFYSGSTLTLSQANISNDSSCGASIVGNPLLSALADNGGPTLTHALQTGSPAINAATGSGLPSTDQRVFARPVGPANDLGAYEFGASAPGDTTPDAFSFTDSTSAAISGGEITSNSINISGINAAATVTISGSTGAMFSIAGGAFGTSGSITNGQSVRVEVNAAAACNTVTTATLTIGGVSTTYHVTTVACDTTPNSFSFTDVNGATKSATGIMSNTVTIGGINTSATVSIAGDTGAKFSINGGAFGTSGSIVNGQSLQLEVDASSVCGTQTAANVTVGAGSAVPFHVNTTACDRTPDTFSFTGLTGADPSSAQVSNEITVAGIDDGTSISISPVGTYTVDGGSTATSGTVNNGGKIIVQLTASASFSTTRTATLTVGTASQDFSVTTRAGHSTPTPFGFTPVTGATPGASVLSSSSLVSGLEIPASIGLDVGQFCVNGTDAGHCFNAGTTLMTVTNNDLVYVRLTASNTPGTKVTGTLDIGGSTGKFDVTTRAALPLDLSLTQSANANPVQINNAGGLIYSLTVHNNSTNDAATSLVLTETLAAGLAYNGFSSSDAWGCTAAGQVVTCNLTSLALGASSSVDITTGTGATAGAVKTVGNVSASEADPAPANNNKNISTLLCDPSAIDSIGFGSASFPATEGAPVTIAVNRSGNSCSNVTVHYATTTGGSAPSSDFTAASGDFTWTALDANKKNFIVSLNDDSIYSGNRTVGLALSSPSANATLTKAASIITIKDDEAPVTVGLSTTDQSVSEEGGVATVTASLSVARAVDTTVALVVSGTATKGKDYTLSAPSILIPAGQLNGSVALTGLTDLLDEADETAIVKMGAVSGASVSGTSTNIITFTDNDATPTVSFDTAASSRNEFKANAVTLVLSAVSGQDVTVQLSSSGGSAADGADYTINGGGTVTIPAGNISATAVTVIDDSAHESSETATFHIDSATHATPSGIQSTTLTIVDNDP